MQWFQISLPVKNKGFLTSVFHSHKRKGFIMELLERPYILWALWHFFFPPSCPLLTASATWGSLMFFQHVSCSFSLRICSDFSVWNVLPPYTHSAKFLVCFGLFLNLSKRLTLAVLLNTVCHLLSFSITQCQLFLKIIYPKCLKSTLIHTYWNNK